MDFALFTKCLQSAPSRVFAGPGGCTNELLRVCLDDVEVLQLLWLQRTLRESLSKAFMVASMTALQKHDGGVRGIATGTTFRMLVAKTLARQFSAEGEAACAPYQFALSTIAGTDCVGHAIRAMTDAWQQCSPLMALERTNTS